MMMQRKHMHTVEKKILGAKVFCDLVVAAAFISCNKFLSEHRDWIRPRFFFRSSLATLEKKPLAQKIWTLGHFFRISSFASLSRNAICKSFLRTTFACGTLQTSGLVSMIGTRSSTNSARPKAKF